MIGLLERGRPRLGVVHVPKAGPHLRRRGGAGRVGGARRAGRRAARRAQAAALLVARADLRAARHRLDRAPRRAPRGRARRARAPRTLSVGSVGYKVGKIAADEADLYVATTPSIHLWDTVGPEAILMAAGRSMFDLDGRPLDYSGPSSTIPAACSPPTVPVVTR
jgi:3'(2'), 5'-bisphosphate nucleotidase